jgi:hypothetical protein
VNHLKEAIKVMGKDPINSLGSCFDAAGINFLNNETDSSDRICHGLGIANMPGQEGRLMGHAWIEFDRDGTRMAFDAIWGIVARAQDYRETLQLKYSVEYTKEQFLGYWKFYDYPGPWDKMILDVVDKNNEVVH